MTGDVLRLVTLSLGAVVSGTGVTLPVDGGPTVRGHDPEPPRTRAH